MIYAIEFDELAPEIQEKVITNEAIRFNKSLGQDYYGYLTINELVAAKERIIKYKWRFTSDGKMIEE